MRNLVRIFFVFLAAAALTGCTEGLQAGTPVVNMFALGDSSAPVILSVRTVDEKTACVVFDESIIPIEDSFLPHSASAAGTTLRVDLGRVLAAGTSQVICGTVRDESGNTVTFSVVAWGLNDNPAQMRINEFTTKGTRTQPDRTELRVMRGGNTAGIVLCDGIPGLYRTMVVLPSFEVQSGSFVTVWWTDVLPSGVKEKEGNNINVLAGGGLSENNGIMCIVSDPSQGCEVRDCVIWSSMESTQFGGYGTKEVLDRVNTALENGWWEGPPVYSGYSTSTRSMALGKDGIWYTTVQGGISFGDENNAAQYNPK